MEETGPRRLPKPNNIIAVPVAEGSRFFRWWCTFLQPFVNFSSRELDIVSELLYQRFELSKIISDQGVLDSMTMSNTVKDKVIKTCGISKEHFYVIMSKLRKNGIIVDGIINPRIIPNIRRDDNGVFQLLILFNKEGSKEG